LPNIDSLRHISLKKYTRSTGALQISDYLLSVRANYQVKLEHTSSTKVFEKQQKHINAYQYLNII